MPLRRLQLPRAFWWVFWDLDGLKDHLQLPQWLHPRKKGVAHWMVRRTVPDAKDFDPLAGYVDDVLQLP